MSLGRGVDPRRGLRREVFRKAFRCRVRKECCGRDVLPRDSGQASAELHRGLRVQPEILEGPIRFGGRARRIAQRRPDFRKHYSEGGFPIWQGHRALRDGALGRLRSRRFLVRRLRVAWRVVGADRVDPVLLALKSVGGQADRATMVRLIHRFPIERDAVAEQVPQRGQPGVRLRSSLALGGIDYERIRPGREAVACRTREHHVRPQFQEARDTLRFEAPNAVGEPDGVPDLASPVLGRTDVFRRDDLSGDIGDDRDERWVKGQTPSGVDEALQHRFHLRRVERVADIQPGCLAADLLEVRSDPLSRVFVPGDHDGHRAVHRGDRCRLAAQQRQHFLLCGLERHHRAVRRELLHQAATSGDQGAGVFQRQDTGEVCGGEFTDRMAQEEVGAQADMLSESEQRHLDREHGSLRVRRLVEQRRLRRSLVAEHDFAKRAFQVVVQ